MEEEKPFPRETMNLSISDLPNLQALLLLAESPAVKLELEKLIKRAETSSQDSPPSPAPVPVSAPVSAPSPAPCPPQPSRTTATSAYTPITTFLFDEGEYNSATVTLHINLPNVGGESHSNIIPSPIHFVCSHFTRFARPFIKNARTNSRMNSLGAPANKSNVSCDFTKSSFDLKILDLEGKSYRLFNNNLSNDINPDKR